ncbi:Tar ligand binding domain-containing protein, partial [Ideonella sp.]|uniref:Tar ligand binding domain-containing protein n=1 Tax=Ideonella sp. TaxID=1929293 RepID=UPI003BB5AAD1
MIKNFSLGLRLGAGFGLVLLLVLAMAGTGVLLLKRISNLNELQDASSERARIADAWSQQTELNLARGMVLAKGGNNSDLNDLLAPAMKVTSEKISSYNKALDEKIDRSEDRALFDALLVQRKAYSVMRDGLMTRLKQGDVAGVSEDADKQLAPVGTAYQKAVTDLRDGFNQTLSQQVAEQNQAIKQGMLILTVLAGLALAAGGVVCVMITRSVTQPVKTAIDASARIAAGDLSQPIHTDRGDELGD